MTLSGRTHLTFPDQITLLQICPCQLDISGCLRVTSGFPGSSAGKESACSAGDLDLIPGLGRSPGEGNGQKYSGLENSMHREAWRVTVHGVSKSQTQLSNFPFQNDLKFIISETAL